MSALREKQCYGLSSGKLNLGGNVSVFHVKLTDSAARAIGTFQNGQVGLHAALPLSKLCCMNLLRGLSLDLKTRRRGLCCEFRPKFTAAFPRWWLLPTSPLFLLPIHVA
uniref:RNA polymerase II elongation factor ELL N-terminal domain-containing protein n=1 Tax=Xiphophorus couchianus TaxID=32473 RepID=A0A3B5MGS5_9TELE